MTDTLKTVIEVAQNSTNDGLELINKVDAFYTSAWDKLIIVGAVMAGIVGIIVPFAIQWYQKKTLVANEKELKRFTIEEMKNIKSDLVKDIELKFKEQNELIKNEIKK